MNREKWLDHIHLLRDMEEQPDPKADVDPIVLKPAACSWLLLIASYSNQQAPDQTNAQVLPERSLNMPATDRPKE